MGGLGSKWLSLAPPSPFHLGFSLHAFPFLFPFARFLISLFPFFVSVLFLSFISTHFPLYFFFSFFFPAFRHPIPFPSPFSISFSSPPLLLLLLSASFPRPFSSLVSNLFPFPPYLHSFPPSFRFFSHFSNSLLSSPSISSHPSPSPPLLHSGIYYHLSSSVSPLFYFSSFPLLSSLHFLPSSPL